MSNLRQENNNLKDSIKNLESDVNALNAEISKINQESCGKESKFLNDLGSLHEELAKKVKDLASMESLKHDLEVKLNNMEQQQIDAAAEAAESLRKLNDIIVKYKEDLNVSNKRCNELESLIKDLKDNMGNKSNSLQNVIDELNLKIEELNVASKLKLKTLYFNYLKVSSGIFSSYSLILLKKLKLTKVLN